MELALPHFQKYGVFNDVAIEDVTASTFEFHLVGTDAAKLLRRGSSELPGEGDYAHKATEFYGFPLRVVRESPTGLPGVTLIGAAADAEPVWKNLLTRGRDFGLIVVDAETFEVLRIAGGTPVFGKDITEKNLPQEIGRDERAISFVKGCYLGQETVARIDALGHVNQLLKGLRFAVGSPCPPAGSVLLHEGKRAGAGHVGRLLSGPRRSAGAGVCPHQLRPGRARFWKSKLPARARSATATVSDLSLSTQA